MPTRSAAVEDHGMLRSSHMTLIQMIMPAETAQATLTELGELGVCEFRDLNESVSAFQRPYSMEIRRLDEMERKIRNDDQCNIMYCVGSLIRQANEEDIPLRSWVGTFGSGLGGGGGGRKTVRVRGAQELDELDEQLTEYEDRLAHMQTNQEALEGQFGELCERRDVLVELSIFLEDTDMSSSRRFSGGVGFSTESHAAAPASGDTDDELLGKQPSTSAAAPEPAPESPLSVTSLLGEKQRSPLPSQSATRKRPAHLVSSIGGTTFVAGVIARRKAEAFERVMWRALRGNALIRTINLPDAEAILPGPQTRSSAPTKKRRFPFRSPAASEQSGVAGEKHSAFIIFSHGRETTERVRKMCIAMGCRLVDVPEGHGERSAVYQDLVTRIDDIKSIVFNSRQAKRTELSKVAESLEAWLVGVRRDKAVLCAMDQFSMDGGRRCLVGEAWLPTLTLPDVDAAMERAAGGGGVGPHLLSTPATIITVLPQPTGLQRPTHFPVTPFTAAFQDMIDAYGIPSYGEINPALFMIASFPFLFAVMFGDIGHAAIMAAMGAVLVVFQERLAGPAARAEMFGMVYNGRWIILLMGLASLFTGLVYNDCFARSLALFPSAYSLDKSTGEVTRRSASAVYAFGIDPIWNRASNAMALTNSYKMKQSILFGLVQMSLGLALSAANMAYRGDWLGLAGSWLPQVLFFQAIFGYLGVLIVIKWVRPRDVSLIILLINMALGFGKVEEGSVLLIPGQAIIQRVLMFLAVACVPWMLFSRPAYMLYQRVKKRRNFRHATSSSTEPMLLGDAAAVHHTDIIEGDAGVPDSHDPDDNVRSALVLPPKNPPSPAKFDTPTGHGEEEGIGDVLMLQMIHTIEFVLGSVSNTASYLRLWALSLAHAQLSEVLWDMILQRSMGNFFFLTVGFAIWFTLTVCIMVVMEGLSAFLHALRLHWVEFNGKFYQGAGVKFVPFCTTDEHILRQLMEEHSA